MFRTTLLFALIALTLQVQAKTQKCPSVMGKTPFDQTKMIGTWYTIAGVFTDENPETMKCAKVDLAQLSTDSGNLMHAKFLTKSRSEGEGFSQPIKDDTTALFYGVMEKNKDGKYDGIYKQGVIATDYDTYCLFMACKMTFNEENKKFEPKLKMEILSRQTTLSEETLKILMNVMSSYDISMDKIIKIDHSDC